MTYDPDNPRTNLQRSTDAYSGDQRGSANKSATGWVIGGLAALALVIGAFLMMSDRDGSNTNAANTGSTGTATTSANTPAAPASPSTSPRGPASTTGSGSATPK